MFVITERTGEHALLSTQHQLGHKSSSDLLLNDAKLIARTKPLSGPNQFEDYLDSVEKHREKSGTGSTMTHTPSLDKTIPVRWKEAFGMHFEDAKVEVALGKYFLRKVLECLDLSFPPLNMGKLETNYLSI